MSFDIPIFPLSTVLFPGMRLPLHIFEERYKRMIRRCRETDDTFGVALLESGEEGEPDTWPVMVGCTAEIKTVATFPDGRLNLDTVARRRFHIESLRTEDDYLMATANWLNDQADERIDVALADELRGILTRHIAQVAEIVTGTRIDFSQVAVPQDPYKLSMWASAVLPFPLLEKQPLLALTSTNERLRRILDLLMRAHVIQRAFELRQSGLFAEKETEENSGPFGRFFSLN